MALLRKPEHTKLFNDILVKSNTEADDEVQLSNLTLIKDTTYDKQRSKRIFAEVVTLPFKLRPERIHQEEFLHPEAKGHFPGEIVERHAKVHEKRIRRHLTVKEIKKMRLKYSSGHYKPPYTSIDDQPIKGNPGDRVYFHYLALSDNSYMGQDEEHNRYYRVPYETAFCFISKGVTTMVNGYIQVEPYWNEDYQEIDVGGKKIRGKLKGNLVVGLAEAPEAHTGVVRRRGANFGQDTRATIMERDIVLYSKGSEFKNKIEGKEVYLMRQWNIIARKEQYMLGGKELWKFQPVGDYVHLRVYKRRGIIISIKDVLEDKAEVLAIGENCKYVSVGSKVIFNTSAEFFNIDDTIFVKEGQIIAEYGD